MSRMHKAIVICGAIVTAGPQLEAGLPPNWVPYVRLALHLAGVLGMVFGLISTSIMPAPSAPPAAPTPENAPKEPVK